LAVSGNAVVPEIVAAAKLRPGAPVVSISTYVELPVCTMGVAELEGVCDIVPELEEVFDGVPELEEVFDGVVELVLESVTDGVIVTDGVAVPVPDAPEDKEGVCERVGVAEGNTTPFTCTAVPYAVPALATLSHIKVGKVATAAPQYTLFSGRSPKLTPLLTGAGG
jgi:hypothetical protein